MANVQTSPDARRSVLTLTPATHAAEVTATATTHAVLATTPNGTTRLWTARSRDEARRIARTYREHGGRAKYAAPVK